MSFLQPLMLLAIPLVAIPILIHLINQWRYQTKQWAAMMFLLAANRMNRGYARLRQWLILSMRVLAIAGLIFAISRPLATSFLGLSGGGRLDTTLVLLDRSPSMQQQGDGQQSKLDTGRRQLASALGTLGSTQWVLIDSNTTQPQTFTSLDALVDSPNMRGASATADVPKMLQGVVDYLTINKPGATDVWICSDMRTADWSPESANWTAVRAALESFPQAVKIHLLAYPTKPENNLSVRVTEVRRESSSAGDAVLLSMQLSQAISEGSAVTKRSVPVQIEIDGARSELTIEMTGRDYELRNHRVPIAGQRSGSGKVSIPADQNNADNEFFFVYADVPTRRVVLVSDDREATRALELAATIDPNGQTGAQVDVIGPEQLDSLILDDCALLIWQTSLPQGELAGAVREYAARDGRVLFFPPTSVTSGIGLSSTEFMGVSWNGWVDGGLSANAAADSSEKVMVENWRGDQDLLAVTRSGVGLPVGQLEIRGYAKLKGEFSQLATLTGGDPLLARVPTEKGAVYFCCAATDPDSSTLATNGIVLYAAIQRAIEQGQAALGNATMRVAGSANSTNEPTDNWRSVLARELNSEGTLSSEYAWQAGVYESEGRQFAINRALAEDQAETVEDKQLERLFAGLDFSRVDDRAGNLSGIVREIWQWFSIFDDRGHVDGSGVVHAA